MYGTRIESKFGRPALMLATLTHMNTTQPSVAFANLQLS